MNLKISVAICTLNRANYLRKALKSLTEQTIETDAFEILVIDNNSTDQTKEVATEEFAHIPNLKYIFEPILGLSQARNTGLKHAKSQYIAYLDDDAIASPPWLEKILDVFDTVEPRPGQQIHRGCYYGFSNRAPKEDRRLFERSRAQG